MSEIIDFDIRWYSSILGSIGSFSFDKGCLFNIGFENFRICFLGY